MIVGSGIDITEVDRIREAIQRFGNRFLNRVFTEAEIRYCESRKNSAERYAARFAAKEAAMKAIGTGLHHGVTWKDFEIGHAAGGRPTLKLSGRGADFADGLGARRIALSLTHTAHTAMAMVILED